MWVRIPSVAPILINIFMKLSEANEYVHTPDMLTTKDEIEAWLSDYGVIKHTINDDLTVDVRTNVDLSGRHIIFLPVQFRKIEANFEIANNDLRSFKGMPNEILGSCYFGRNRSLSSWAFAPRIVGGTMGAGLSMDSFHNIHKHVDYIGHSINSNTATSCFLGLLFIKGLQHLSCSNQDVARIFNKYLKVPYNYGSPLRDIHSCQEELIEAGLAEYAKL